MFSGIASKQFSISGLCWPSTNQDTAIVPADLDGPLHDSGTQCLELEPSMVEMTTPLGQGAFGTVHLGRLCRPSHDPKAVAIKTLSPTLNESDRSEYEQKFLSEARLLASLSHPHIITLLGVVSKSKPVMMIMELMSTDLKTHLRQNTNVVTLDDQIRMCLQVGAAVDYLARRNIIHRDIAARSVLKSSSSDFGPRHIV